MTALRTHLLIAASVAGLLVSTGAFAEDAVPVDNDMVAKREATREKLKNATPEQKEEAKEKLHERVENATPEQKEAFKKKLHERYENATPEQKKHIRERIREHRENHIPEQKEAL